MAKYYIIFWFDTEDYINPGTNDAVLQLAQIFEKYRVHAVFKIVGEKARFLERLGRNDVIKALGHQEIGFHSNWHSRHPMPTEYAEGLEWFEAVEEFRCREEPGFRDVERIFKQIPSCYGQPGSAYIPQAYEIMKQWNVPVYLGNSVFIGLPDRPCWFQNVFTIGRMDKLHARFRPWGGEKAFENAKARLNESLKVLDTTEGGVISHGSHPMEFSMQTFTDIETFIAVIAHVGYYGIEK